MAKQREAHDNTGLPNRMVAETLPCGHTKAQAAWLGCTEDECRPADAMIARQVLAQREGR